MSRDRVEGEKGEPMRSRRRLVDVTTSTAIPALATLITVFALAPPAGSGARAPRCLGKLATIVGTAGANVLTGTPRRDVIVGRGGDDRINGLGRGDIVCGGAGGDRIFGGRGKDRLIGGRGPDFMDGGP